MQRISDVLIPEQLSENVESTNIETWDYSNPPGFSNQRDWNNTLVTVINRVSAQIHATTFRGGGNIIQAHPRYRHLFKNMDYVREVDGHFIFSGRYKVFLDEDTPEDEIRVYADVTKDHHIKELDGTRFRFILIPNQDEYGVSRDISLKVCDMNDEANSGIINRFVNNTVGVIKINNYTKDSEQIEEMEAIQASESTYNTAPTAVDMINRINLGDKTDAELSKDNYRNSEPTPLGDIPEQNNEDILKEYLSTVRTNKGILFYFTNYTGAVTRDIRDALVHGNMMAKHIKIDTNDYEGGLEKMNEISSSKNFSHWATKGFEPTDKENYNKVWGVSELGSGFDKVISTELSTNTYTRLKSSINLDEIKGDNKVMLSVIKSHKQDLINELGDTHEVRQALNRTITLGELKGGMSFLGYELTNEAYTTGEDDKLPEHYWVKTSPNTINDKLYREWEISIYNGLPTEQMIKLLYELVEGEVSKLKKFNKSDTNIEKIVTYVINNMHNFNPKSKNGDLISYLRVMIRGQIKL